MIKKHMLWPDKIWIIYGVLDWNLQASKPLKIHFLLDFWWVCLQEEKGRFFFFADETTEIPRHVSTMSTMYRAIVVCKQTDSKMAAIVTNNENFCL